jgi:putative FmdB family regulatory protein
MPIYEYQCKECEHRLEAIQRFSDAPLTLCPVCEKSGLVKQLSAPSFRLKGGGWYETDFKTGKKKHGTQQESDNGGSSIKPSAPITPSTPSTPVAV